MVSFRDKDNVSVIHISGQNTKIEKVSDQMEQVRFSEIPISLEENRVKPIRSRGFEGLQIQNCLENIIVSRSFNEHIKV